MELKHKMVVKWSFPCPFSGESAFGIKSLILSQSAYKLALWLGNAIPRVHVRHHPNLAGEQGNDFRGPSHPGTDPCCGGGGHFKPTKKRGPVGHANFSFSLHYGWFTCTRGIAQRTAPSNLYIKRRSFARFIPNGVSKVPPAST